MNVLMIVVLALGLAVPVVAPTPSPSVRQVLVINTGNVPIFTLRVGDASTQHWGSDALGFDGVIDIGRGRMVRFPVDRSTCVADVRARFQGGAVIVMSHVDVCTVRRLTIGNAMPHSPRGRP